MAKPICDEPWLDIILNCWLVGLPEGWVVMELREKGYDDQPTIEAARFIHRRLTDILRRAPPIVKSYKGVPQ